VSLPVGATDIVGKVTVTAKFIEQLDSLEQQSEGARGYWNEPNGVKAIAPPTVNPASDFGVVLVKDGQGDMPADEVKSLNVLTGRLEKTVTVIRPKSRIKFIMRSPFDHELYSPGKHDFKPQMQSANTFRPIDFYSAGVFEVKCMLFPGLKGWIVVFPATRILELDDSGAFKVDDLAPGKYHLKVFFNGGWIHDQLVEVDGSRQEIAVELTRPTPASPAEAKEKVEEKNDGGEKGAGEKKEDSKPGKQE